MLTALLAEGVATSTPVGARAANLLDIDLVGTPAFTPYFVDRPVFSELNLHILRQRSPRPWVVDGVAAVAERCRWLWLRTGCSEVLLTVSFLTTVLAAVEPRSVAIAVSEFDIVLRRALPGDSFTYEGEFVTVRVATL